MGNLEYFIERLREIRWMRKAYGAKDYRKLSSGCEACAAPPGEHWGDCNRDDPDRPMLTERL